MTKIRSITRGDFQSVIEMINKTQLESYKCISPQALISDKLKTYTKDSLSERITGADYFVAVDENGAIVGVIGLKSAEIRTFFVDPDCQGKGVGRQLYDVAEAKAREIGLEKLSVNASKVGEPVYRHFGFVKIGDKHKERVGIHYTDALMEKHL